MPFSEQRFTNWGCMGAMVVTIPLFFFVFIIGSMSGGGCEGAPEPCEGDYTPMWLIFGALLVIGLVLAKLINLIIAQLHKQPPQ